MTITKRSAKGLALTYAEMDENFRDLDSDMTLDRVLKNGNTTARGMSVDSAHFTTLSYGTTYYRPGETIKSARWVTGTQTSGIQLNAADQSTAFQTITINAADAAGYNCTGIGARKSVQFEKIHNQSHVEVQYHFPYYFADEGGSPGNGFGVRAQISKDGGNTFTTMGNSLNASGPYDTWGGGGYGGNDAGSVDYIQSTYDDTATRSSYYSHTGNIEIRFQVRLFSAPTSPSPLQTHVLYFISYPPTDQFPKYGAIRITEIKV